MRLSESLRRNIMETRVGGIINKFKGRRRRDILFFEDILANYIKECENAGHGKEMFDIGRHWTNLGMQSFLPSVIKKISLQVFFNVFAKKLWTNIGLMDDLVVIKETDRISINSKNEYFTRIIGKNEFNAGLLVGVIDVLEGREAECIEKAQSKEESRYVCQLKNKPWIPPKVKEKNLYNSQNYLPVNKGSSLKNALERGVLVLKHNRIYFRDQSVIPIENTLIHLFSNKGILHNKISEISFNLFSDIIRKEFSKEKKLRMLKNILQILGWGEVKISVKNNSILFSVKYPPCGLQTENDNWAFLAEVVQGYLWLLDKKTKINKTEYRNRVLRISYSF